MDLGGDPHRPFTAPSFLNRDAGNSHKKLEMRSHVAEGHSDQLSLEVSEHGGTLGMQKRDYRGKRQANDCIGGFYEPLE